MNVPVTRDGAIKKAAQILVANADLQASRTPREAAEAAWYPFHPLGSVEDIEASIIRRRAEDVETLAAQAARQPGKASA